MYSSNQGTTVSCHAPEYNPSDSLLAFGRLGLTDLGLRVVFVVMIGTLLK